MSTGRAATCPYCLDAVVFDPRRLHVRTEGRRSSYEPASFPDDSNPVRRDELVRRLFQLCTNSTGIEDHFIPVPYLVAGPPITVAMVGASAAGKTHLLTAMLGEVDHVGLDRYGLSRRAVNGDWHNRFVEDQVNPLRQGRVLAGTPAADGVVDFADALLLSRRGGGTRPVAFFDLAGEDLIRSGPATRFLAGVDAFLFVVDPLPALAMAQLDEERARAGVEAAGGDLTFGTVLDRIRRSDGDLLEVPVAVVVNKSDLLRFEPPVDRWLREPLPAALDPGLVEQESRDVYAFLRHHGAEPWLRPFKDCRRCTLHFVSATGGSAQDGRFAGGARGRRVLAPLLSILAMTGMLGEDLARSVGT